jgi:hypothetical protein
VDVLDGCSKLATGLAGANELAVLRAVAMGWNEPRVGEVTVRRLDLDLAGLWYRELMAAAS